MEPKDYFSGHSQLYATFRPVYPNAIYEFIYKHLKGKESAWDCGTGNGQAARELAKHFKQVCATDISANQMGHAHHADNIFYSISPAEKTAFHENQFDLITVAQALHWFKVEEFYKEVNRVAKENALLAVWGYELCKVDKKVDPLFLDFYHNIVGPFWDEARKLVENEYRDIPFPFESIDTPNFVIEANWSLENFLGYLTTWSATQKYMKKKGHNPVIDLFSKLEEFWSINENKVVTFPIFMKLGKVKR